MRPENSQSQFPFDPGDVLDRATQSLRDTPTPQGPSPMLIASTQAALRRARLNGATGRSIFPFPAVLRIAATIAVICGVVAIYLAAHRNGMHGVTIISQTGQSTADGAKPPANPDSATPQNSHTPAPLPAATLMQNQSPQKHQEPPAPASPILADGVLAGRIIFDGVAPPPRPLLGFNIMPECTRMHGGAIYDESMVVGPDGALANVVVSVSDGLSGWLREEYPPPPPAILDQRGCVFEPHVVPVMVGQQLSIKNSDPFLHNVHVMAVNNPPANLGQPTISESATAPFESPEVFQVRCDVHPWMQAWVRVVDNPFFAVTGRDGRFSIRGLPPGTYTLKAWHEQLGVREQQIVITPGEGTAADFTFHAGR